MALSLAPLEKAVASLERALAQPKDEFVRDSVVQRFEYTYELAWKALKRYFELNQGLSEANVKNIWREAGNQGLVQSVESWFGYHEARNQTSHTYSEETAERIYQVARQFQPDVRALLSTLQGLER